jgi:hypothetical protein
MTAHRTGSRTTTGLHTIGTHNTGTMYLNTMKVGKEEKATKVAMVVRMAVLVVVVFVVHYSPIEADEPGGALKH